MGDLTPYVEAAHRMMPDFLTEPEWLALIVAILTALQQNVGTGQRLWKRWQQRFIPRDTQVHKDRANYELLLQKYEGYLTVLQNLIVIRSQVEAGSTGLAPELEQQLVQTRDRTYYSLEKRSDREDDMGVFQLLDILEGRNVDLPTDKRAELQARQVKIENHPLFIKRRPEAA